MKKTTQTSSVDSASDGFSRDGVDLTLIRWMLSLSPAERMQALEDHAGLIQEMRDANPALSVPQDTPDTGS